MCSSQIAQKHDFAPEAVKQREFAEAPVIALRGYICVSKEFQADFCSTDVILTATSQQRVPEGSLYRNPPHAMRISRFICFVAVPALLLLLPSSDTAFAQAPKTAAASEQQALSAKEIAELAKLHVAISVVQDSADAQLAEPRNKTPQAQQQLREKFRADVAAVIERNGLTETEYKRRRFLVSSNQGSRAAFDTLVANLTGTPIPGALTPAAAAVTASSTGMPSVPVPAGAAGVHVGHVVKGFGDTPGGMGLLPTAMIEASTAAQHAALAVRASSDLVAMKLHAGHVLNALDPTIEPKGPGRGYGVKKAATGVASHIELAAKADGASANIKMHSAHVAAAARAALSRVDQVIALAKQVQTATDASEAAKLVTQMASLSDGLIKGVDVNSDGRITWDGGEGGLQQAQEHVNLLLAGEKK